MRSLLTQGGLLIYRCFCSTKVQHATAFKRQGNDARRGCVGVAEMWREGTRAELTSELRLYVLWRAGHPVELFLARPEECKAATPPSSHSSGQNDEGDMLPKKCRGGMKDCGGGLGSTGTPSEPLWGIEFRGENTKYRTVWDSC